MPHMVTVPLGCCQPSNSTLSIWFYITILRLCTQKIIILPFAVSMIIDLGIKSQETCSWCLTPLNPSTGGLLLSSVIINYPCSLNIICPLGNHFSFEALNLPTLCLLVDFLPLFIFLDHLPQNLERILHSQFFLILRFL